jgi:hypothetical protein
LLIAIADLLKSSPPSGSQGNIYVATNISGVDTEWNISIDNLINVSDPYNDWNILENVAWAWSVVCSGSEPTWTCAYYVLPAQGGGEQSTGLRFPWKTGYSALYGVSGVHRDTSPATLLPGDYAVDFVGQDSVSYSMPPLAVAAANGTITNVCTDKTSIAIRVDGGPVILAYFHLALGQSFSEGERITQGQVIGSLAYGTFSGGCGTTHQQSDQYHLHFAFLPTSSGYLEIGGCVLDLSSQNFVCNSNTYASLSYIPNGGSISNPSTPTPGAGTPTAIPGLPNPPATGGGGPHIWDGIVSAIVSFNVNTISQYLPTQNPLVQYMEKKVSLVIQFSIGFFFEIYAFGLSGSLLMIVLSTVITMNIALWIVEIAVSLFKQFGWLAKYLI